jgi:DNA-nicking Smr family endonuclease
VKKRKTDSAPKEKPFSPSPFRDLKGLRVEPPPALIKPPPKPKPKPEPEEIDDVAIFLREMADVRRVEGGARKGVAPEKKPAPHPLVRQLEEEESRLFLEALQGIQVRFHDEFPDEGEPLQPVSLSRMKRLKRGEIRIDLELDLHGLTREEALQALSAFIGSAWRRGQQAVLVITGKGLNSPGEPVLQGAVAAWLRDAGKPMVAEFSPAPGRMGGSGAFVVFLKENPAVKGRETPQ